MIRPFLRKIHRKAKKGSGDAVAFIWLTPVIVIILIMLVTYVKLMGAKQKMSYAAYCACRAASVCTSFSDAQDKSMIAAIQNLGSYGDVIDIGTLDVTLTIVPGDGTKAGKKISKKQVRKNKNKHSWDKGNYVTCILTASPAPGNNLIQDDLQAQITLAIEYDSDNSTSNSNE